MRIAQLRQADLNLLVYFIALAEEKSISGAAKRLRLSQPAISRAFQRLRELFRDDLLIRAGKAYEPTPKGQTLLQELAVILPQLEKLISGKDFDPFTEEATFRITAADSLAHLYGAALARRHDARPNLLFSFQTFTDDRLNDLESNRADMVLDAEFRTLPANLRSERLFDESFVCAVAKKSGYPNRLSLSQYLTAHHIGISVLGNRQAVPDIALAKVGAIRRCAFTVPYFGVGLRMVAGTSLIVTLPKRMAELVVNQTDTRLVLPPRELGGFRYTMVWHSRQELDTHSVWLRHAIREATTELLSPTRSV